MIDYVGYIQDNDTEGFKDAIRQGLKERLNMHPKIVEFTEQYEQLIKDVDHSVLDDIYKGD